MFRHLFFGLRDKRLRQGYGLLYNFNTDDDDLYKRVHIIRDYNDHNDIKDYLEDKDEEPVKLAGKCIKDMTEKYREYKKISIFKN
ncbi:MAG: hypothetical protein ACYDIA_02720 [Candidatus Humimicrobiaceae bacterium]